MEARRWKANRENSISEADESRGEWKDGLEPGCLGSTRTLEEMWRGICLEFERRLLARVASCTNNKSVGRSNYRSELERMYLATVLPHLSLWQCIKINLQVADVPASATRGVDAVRDKLDRQTCM